MANKNICLISRSSYPFPISKHTQNMQTFEGWMRFWENIIIVSQCDSNKIQRSYHKRIYGVLLPLILNKYLNVIYFTFFGIFEIRKLFKKYNFEIFQASDAGGAILALLVSRIYRKKFIFEVQGDIFDYPSKVGGKTHSTLVKYFSKALVKRADYIRIVSPFLYGVITDGVDFHSLSLKFVMSNFSLNSFGRTSSRFVRNPVASTTKLEAKFNSTSNVPKFP